MDHCATRLAAREDPALETLKMQLAIEDTAATQTKTAAKEARDRDDRVGALERDVADAVVDSATVSGREERLLLDRLHDAAFRYVCVACRMEIALEDDDVAEETRAAFESVFPLATTFADSPFLPASDPSASASSPPSCSASASTTAPSAMVDSASTTPPRAILPSLTPPRRTSTRSSRAPSDWWDNTRHIALSELKTIRAQATSFRRLTDEHNNRRCYGDALRRCAEECARGAAAVRALSESLDGALAAVRRMLAEGGTRRRGRKRSRGWTRPGRYTSPSSRRRRRRRRISGW